MERQKLISTIIICCISVAVIVGAVFGIVKFNNPLDIQLIDKRTSEYLVMNVPSNYNFKIVRERAGDVNVYELDGNPVDTEIIEKGTEIEVKAPSDGYEPGAVYTIDISDVGSFSNEELIPAKKVMFVIKRKNASNIEYTEKVKDLQDKDAAIKSDRIVLEGTDYQAGDIVLVDTDEDDIQEIYKLDNVTHKKEKTISTYSEPQADEVYKEIDIFFYDDIDMDNIAIDEEKLYGNLKESGILNIVFDDVYAADKEKLPEIEFDAKEVGDKKYSLKITIKYPDNPVKLVLKTTVSCKTFYKNEKNDNTGNVFLNNRFTIANDVKISVEGELGEVKESEIKKSLENFISLKDAEVEAMEYEIPIIPLKYSIAGPIYAKFDLGMKGTLEIGGKMEFGVKNELVFTEGLLLNYKKAKVLKTYCEVEPVIEASVLLEGRTEAFAGFYADGGVVVPLLVTAEAKGSVGPYFDAKGCLIIEKIPKNSEFEGYYDVETGIKYDADINITLLKTAKIKVPLVDKKIRIWAKSNSNKLKDVDISDTYYLRDGKVRLGELHATYHDVIEDEDNTETIERYQLFVDGSQIRIEDGYFTLNKESDNCSIRIKWEKDNTPFEYEKDVRVEEYNIDPIGYFSAISMIGQPYSYVDNKYSLRQVNQTDSWKLMESKNGMFEFAFNATDIDDEIPDYYRIAPTDKCYRMSGTARDIFGIANPVSFSEFESITNTILGYGSGVDLGTGAESGMVDLIKLPGQNKYYHMLLEDIGYREPILPETRVHIQGYFNEGEIIKEGGY